MLPTPQPGTPDRSSTVTGTTCYKSKRTNRNSTRLSRPWTQGLFPPEHETCDRGHGRIDRRWTATAPAPPGLFPHTKQIVRTYRERCTLDDEIISTETAWHITDLTPQQATTPQAATLVRGQWEIENRLHYVRDVTYQEDQSQTYRLNGPRAMATLRNLSISIFNINGHTNIAQATRHHARNINKTLTLLGIP
jgi:hypothetical protein